MLCQGQRGIIEIEFANTGSSCSTRTSRSSPSWAGWASSTWSTDGAGAAAGRAGAGWRLWALVPILLLVGVVSVFAATGDSIGDLVGRNPPPTRRVRHPPGRVRARRDPDPRHEPAARRRSRSRSVTVDDAIVPYTLDGPGTLERLRSRTIVVPFEWVEDDPISVGVTSSTRDRDDGRRSRPRSRRRGASPRGVPRLRADRASSSASSRSRSGSIWLPSLRRADAALAGRVHGAHGRPAHASSPSTRSPRRSPSRRRFPAGSAAPGSSCSASRPATSR